MWIVGGQVKGKVKCDKEGQRIKLNGLFFFGNKKNTRSTLRISAAKFLHTAMDNVSSVHGDQAESEQCAHTHPVTQCVQR